MTTQNEPPYRRVDSDPWHNPAQPGSMRRLIEFTFLCPLCEGTHQPQFYFTMPTLDYDFFSEAMVNFMESPAALDTALKVARQIHLDEGNLADLHRPARRQIGRNTHPRPHHTRRIPIHLRLLHPDVRHHRRDAHTPRPRRPFRPGPGQGHAHLPGPHQLTEGPRLPQLYPATPGEKAK